MLTETPGNRLLPHLPDAARARLAPYLEPVPLDRGQVLFRAHETLTSVYFPTTAIVSLVSGLETGETLEVGLVGRDGAVGVAICPDAKTMPCDAITQIAGAAHRVDAAIFRRELRADPALFSLFTRHAELLFVRCMQMSVCNTFHSVERRCVRWLLTVHDLIEQDAIALTHELLATMLGVHRSTVTLVLGTLQRSGLVEEERGRIVIHERRRLETASCECYRLMRDEQRRLLGY
jgi:CRP-like cAMP-binding protein